MSNRDSFNDDFDYITLGKKVLVIDDSITVVKSLAKILRQAGMLPIECIDGEQALTIALSQKPDLILLDLVMPRVSGLEVLKALRDHELLVALPIVVITANKEDEQIIEALETGADDYITKPFNEPVLLARLHTHLRSWQLLRELEEANQHLQQAREQEVKNERLRSAVEMAGAAAHKLNQPLTSIVCYADILLKKLTPDNEDYKALKSICEESERMAMILRKMSEIPKVRTEEYVGGTTIIDLDRSFEKTDPGILIKPDRKK